MCCSDHLRSPQQTDEGWAWTNHIIKNDTAFCFGEPLSETTPIGIDGKADAYIIDEDLSNAHIARSILTGKTAKEYNKAVEWTEDYKVADALLWSRAMSGHKINIELSQSYEMADRSFSSDVWKDTESDPYIQREAQIFKYAIQDGKSIAQAHTEVLADYLEDDKALASKDRSFLKWYDKFLHERTELRVSVCMGFDGSIETCMSTETVVPGENVAASNLSADTLEQLRGVYTSTPYLSTNDANDLLGNDSYKTVDVSVASDFAKAKNNAERCCGENRSNDSNGTFGLSFSGKFGIAF